MTDTHIEEGWKQFRAKSLSPTDNAGRDASNRAIFFCGAKFMMEEIGKHTTFIVGSTDEIDSLKRELTTFMEKMMLNMPTEGSA